VLTTSLVVGQFPLTPFYVLSSSIESWLSFHSQYEYAVSKNSLLLK
jgi:hypothetical protein